MGPAKSVGDALVEVLRDMNSTTDAQRPAFRPPPGLESIGYPPGLPNPPGLPSGCGTSGNSEEVVPSGKAETSTTAETVNSLQVEVAALKKLREGKQKILASLLEQVVQVEQEIQSLDDNIEADL